MEALLNPTFAATHVTALLNHHQAMVKEFQQGAWEECIGKAGKFVEAVLKALWVHTGNTLGPAREFKVDKVINQLPNFTTFDDSIRLTIPRACRFAYDIASNRGARHDPNEVDPNVMDATAVVAMNAWILGEMVRYAQKGSVNPAEVKELVDGITEKKYPLIEDVDGKTYFHFGKLSARDVAFLLLWRRHPGRITRADLVEGIKRHGFRDTNADEALSRLSGWVDVDDKKGLRALLPGIQHAEALFAKVQSGGGLGKPHPRGRKKKRKATPSVTFSI
jgi:hypothetical protein